MNAAQLQDELVAALWKAFRLIEERLPLEELNQHECLQIDAIRAALAKVTK
jgi:hypothetical protein